MKIVRWLPAGFAVIYAAFLLVIDIVKHNPWWAFLIWGLGAPTFVVIILWPMLRPSDREPPSTPRP